VFLKKSKIKEILIVLLVFFFPLLAQDKIFIKADKMVLEKNGITEFRGNVLFRSKEIEGTSEELRKFSDEKIMAEKDVYVVVKSTGKELSLWTQKIFLSQEGDKIYSDVPSEFLIEISTGESVNQRFRVFCSSFTGNYDKKLFILNGKPVKIKGDGFYAYARNVFLYPDFAKLKSEVFIDYFKDPFCRIYSDSGIFNFKVRKFSFFEGVKAEVVEVR